MSEKALKFNNIGVNKKEFHKSRQSIDLMSINIDKIVVLTNLSIATKALSISLVTKNVKLLNGYALSDLK